LAIGDTTVGLAYPWTSAQECGFISVTILEPGTTITMMIKCCEPVGSPWMRSHAPRTRAQRRSSRLSESPARKGGGPYIEREQAPRTRQRRLPGRIAGTMPSAMTRRSRRASLMRSTCRRISAKTSLLLAGKGNAPLPVARVEGR